MRIIRECNAFFTLLHEPTFVWLVFFSFYKYLLIASQAVVLVCSSAWQYLFGLLPVWECLCGLLLLDWDLLLVARATRFCCRWNYYCSDCYLLACKELSPTPHKGGRAAD